MRFPLRRMSGWAVVPALALATSAVVSPAASADQAVAPATAAPTTVAPSAVGARLPSQLMGVGGARQLIVVTDPRGSYATLTGYEKRSGIWRRIHGPMSARIGPNGFVRGSERVQGSGTTPAGSYRLGPAFGQGSSPGTAMPYRVVDSNDRWVYDRNDPSTYNTYQPSGNWGNQERLAEIGYRQYRYAVVVGFNYPVMTMSTTARPRASSYVNTRRGGGIFLHVTKRVGGESRPTAGCISVDEPQMRALLQWLRPSLSPRIIMGPRSWILKPEYRYSSAATDTSSVAAALAGTATRIGSSRQGRGIYSIYVGPRNPRSRLAIIGVIHGNERYGRSVVTRLRSMDLPAGLGVWLIPSMNPDGEALGRRTNSAGVDLNRNFPYSWRYAGVGTTRYSGPSAASERETRVVMGHLRTVNPDLVVIFHSPYGGVDSYQAKSISTVRALSSKSGFPYWPMDCGGPCHGTLTQWFNNQRPGQAVTFEFGSSAPSAATVRRVAGAVASVAASL